MVPARVAELAACLTGDDRPGSLDPQRYLTLAALLPESLSAPVGGDLDAVVELLRGIGEADADLAAGPGPVPRHELLREVLSDRAGGAQTWFEAIRAWRHWEHVWHAVRTDPAGAGVLDLADGLIWLGPGGGDAHRRLREAPVPDVRDGDIVVGHLVDPRRDGAWFAGGRLGPRRFASVLAAAYGRTDRLRGRRVLAVGIPPDTPAEHAELFELATGRLREVLDEAGTGRRVRDITCTVLAGGADGESGPVGGAPSVAATAPATSWVEIVLPTGERFDLQLPRSEDAVLPADYPVEQGPDGRRALVCLDDVQAMYALARSNLPGAQPALTRTGPLGPDHTGARRATAYLEEIASLSALINERFELLPAAMRPPFEAALAGARALLAELPRPDRQNGRGDLPDEQVVLLREKREAMRGVAESMVHGVLRPDVAEPLFREAAQLLDAAIRRRAEDARSRVTLLDQPHREIAAAELDRIQHERAQSLQTLRGEASAARGAGDFSQQDMRRLEHQAYRCTLDAFEQMGALLERLGREAAPVR
jgi:hypothetical protein